MRSSDPPPIQTRYTGDSETTGDGGEGGMPQNWRAGRLEYLILAALSVSTLMVSIDGGILAPALPVIMPALHGTAIGAWWSGTSFLLTSSVAIPLASALSDIFGRQELLMVSLILFTVGSLIAAISTNMAQFLAGRSVQGVGGGGVLAVSQVIFTDFVPLRQRPIFMAPVMIFGALGAAVGPLFGGIFAKDGIWRWIFYINFPLCAAGLMTVQWVVRLRMRHASSLREKLLRVDWFGSGLFIAGMTSFLVALTWGGVLYPWGSVQTIAPLAIGLVVVAGSFVWARWGTDNPFVRMRVFGDRTAAAAYICSIIQGMLLFGQFYFIPLYFQAVRGLSSFLSGVALLPVTCAFFSASVAGGVTISKIGQFRWAIWSGWFLTITGSGLLIILDEDTDVIAWVLIFLILGAGTGFLIVSLNTAVQATARSQDTACATAMYLFTRVLGTCIGIALGGTVFQNALLSSLANAHLPTDIAQDAVGYVKVINGLPAGSEHRRAVIRAYVEAFHSLYEVLTAMSFVGGLSGLLIDPQSLDKVLDSEHTLETEKPRNPLP